MAGTVEITTTDTSFNERLGLDEDGAPSDGSIEAATTAVTTALDAWLESAQSGTPDLLLLRGVWVQQRDPAAAELLQTGIANPDNPVAGAAYRLDVQLEPDPTLVVASIEVARRDGTSVQLEMVFDVTDGQPLLHLVGAPEVV